MDDILIVNGLNKNFSKNIVLKNISFTLKRNRILVILGPSGSGKTTLCRILCQLESADSGEIFISGLKLNESKVQDKKILSKVGLVFQSFNLFPHLTVLENITIAYRFLHKKKSIEEAKSLAMKLLKKVNLEEKSSKYPCTLSGGESQRIAITRSLALSPEILFFDEPTSALDPEMIKNLSQLLLQIRKDENNTLVVVTHDINFAKMIADDVFFLEKGEKVYFGSAREIFDNPDAHPRVKEFLKNVN